MALSIAIWRAIAARRAASARRRASRIARRLREETRRSSAARSRLVRGRPLRRSRALIADDCSRATSARWRRTSRAESRPPRRRDDLATSRPPRRDERFRAVAFLLFEERALRPEACFFLPKAVPEKTRQIRINAIKTRRCDLGE